MSEQQREQHSSLLELNPQLSLANGIYQNTSTQIRDTQLSSYIQGAVNDSLNNADDHSLYSVDIETLLLTDELRSAFSTKPVNFLLSFNFSGIGRTLDLTQSFGGATHFLADKVGSIDCVRTDIGHARLTAKRCSEFSNISYVSEDISLLNIPKKSYDLIIISQLESLALNKSEQATLFDKLRDSLSERGCLVVSARNRNRLDKWLSPGPDAIAYKALYQNESNNNYTEEELELTIRDAGFEHLDSYASFSPPGAIDNLFSKQYLSRNPDSLNHFNRLGGIDNGNLNEYLLFKNLGKETFATFNIASRFVMIAGASKKITQALCNNDFAHFPGLGRKPQWRATTQSKNGSNVVTKTLLHEHYNRQPEGSAPTIKLSQSTEPQAFQPGTLLLDKWLSALLEDDPLTSLKHHVNEYAQWLQTIEQQDDFCQRAYDALPFNIIVDEHTQFKPIDPEWVIDTHFESDFVLFRALFWFAFENKALMKGLVSQSGAPTIGLFVLQFMDGIEHLDELTKFVAMEEIIQGQIGQGFRKKAVEYALLQTFDGEPLPQRLQPACQISWSDNAGIVDEHNSIFVLWNSSTQLQTLKANAPTVVSGKDILRIDPIASMGLFGFESIKLFSEDNTLLWQVNSGIDIAEASKGLNVSAMTSGDGTTHFIALNEDPHFLFTLSDIEGWEQTHKIELRFSLIHNQYYDAALANLSRAVSEQNIALERQVGVLDSKRAEIEYLASKLENIDQHRQALKASMHQAQLDKEKHINSLNTTLNAQIERTRQLENHPIIKLILRLNRLAARLRAKISPKR